MTLHKFHSINDCINIILFILRGKTLITMMTLMTLTTMKGAAEDNGKDDKTRGDARGAERRQLIAKTAPLIQHPGLNIPAAQPTLPY